MGKLDHLRPIERRISRLVESGVSSDEIGSRFNRSGAFVERVIEFANLPGRHRAVAQHELRPIERRLMRWSAAGASPEELASRFRRSPDNIQRVLGFADLKRARGADASR
jgi:DNA-binding CsgD family transcriptional regulator